MKIHTYSAFKLCLMPEYWWNYPQSRIFQIHRSRCVASETEIMAKRLWFGWICILA